MEKAYAMYLRKSRKDAVGESVEETLARHEQRLQQLAQQQGLVIGTVYREVVSGDSIAARPEMQRLLQAVQRGQYQGGSGRRAGATGPGRYEGPGGRR